MNRITLLALALVCVFWCTRPAHATDAVGAQTVSACGTPNNTPVTGNSYPITMDPQARQCVNGTFSATGGIVPYQAVTVVGSAQKGITTASAVGITVDATAKFCNVSPTVANVNYETDGSNPTTGTSGGLPLSVGQTIQLPFSVASTFKAINQTGASGALLNAECYK